MGRASWSVGVSGVVWVTVSMRVMSAGHGYRYLTSSVAIGDGQRQSGLPLTAYYTADGTPPGRWLGSGLAGLGDGRIRAGDVVEEAQLALLLGEGRDPITGAPLGRAYPQYLSRAERVAARVAQLDGGLDREQRAAAMASIESAEASRPTRRAVAGFDLTFSVPKSVSVLWALAPAEVQAKIVAAHHAAIDDVLRLFEAEVAATRMGADAGDGAVAQVDVTGVSAVAFDHVDSRAGDPQLHTHVVIANKVQTALDGKWRSLDGRPIHAAMVALSEHYRAVLADHLTRTLGLTWHQRDRGADRNACWDLTGVPEELLELFSSRAAAIGAVKDDLVAAYVAEHGHQPTARTVLKLRQQATLATRPDKTVTPLAALMTSWRERASAVLARPAEDWAAGLLHDGQRRQQLLTADALSEATVAGVAAQVVDVVGERRSTWHRWNLHAETSRQLTGVRFATTTDRERLVRRIVHAAEQQSVRLTPPELATVPAELRRADGTSVLRPRHSEVFTSAELLAAEDRLLDLGRTTTAPTLPPHTSDQAVTAGGLGNDQAAAVTAVATSGRVVDVLIGPAGAGKTTAMRTLRQAWTSLYGANSVIGLAPSAAAAEVLGQDLGVPADTLAKWLHDHHAGNATLTAGQLVIIDEASLAGTRSLHTIADHAATVGAKVLVVGDPAQLASVDAGGALQLLARDRDDVAYLTDVRRFTQPWEAAATLQLRDGNPTVLDTYSQHDRLHDGDTEQMLNTAYTAWQTDQAAGKHSLLIAPTRDQVLALNIRAQADLIASGHVDAADTVALHDGTTAGVGDVVVTRRNDRRLHGAGGWVRNGDRWRITALHPDGTVDVRRQRLPSSSPTRLPASYVDAHVELGYATTVHRAQGATVDTAHAIVGPGMTRETLYVAMTRGRQSNDAYTCTDTLDIEAHQHTDAPTGWAVLAGVLARIGAEASAHQMITAEQDRYGSIAQLAAEYDTIAAAAQRPRWTSLIRACGLREDQVEAVIASDAFGPLCATLRTIEAHRLDVSALLPRLVHARPLEDVDDIAAVLHHRAQTAVSTLAKKTRARPPDLIAGLIPVVTGSMSGDMRTALDVRQQLIQQRAEELGRTALADGARWTRHLGRPPSMHTDAGSGSVTWPPSPPIATVTPSRAMRHSVEGSTSNRRRDAPSPWLRCVALIRPPSQSSTAQMTWADGINAPWKDPVVASDTTLGCAARCQAWSGGYHRCMTMTAVDVDTEPALFSSATSLFRSLGDPTRLAILQLLAGRAQRVVDLTGQLELAQSTVSAHCACLRDCGLIVGRPEGRATVYALAPEVELRRLLAAAEDLLAATGHAVALCPAYGDAVTG